MKESEAVKKWCPMKRAVPDAMNYQSGNVFDGFNASPLDNKCMCIGSDCMMWESLEYGRLGNEVDGVTPVIVVNKGEGDCGLKSKESNCFYPG